MAHMMWNGSASSEGGPLLLAEAKDYAHWFGSEPRPNEPFRLWYYGKAVQLLPEDLQPCGKDHHQIARVASIDEANQIIEGIREVLRKVAPAVEEHHQRPMTDAELRSKALAAMDNANDEAMQSWLTAWRDHVEQGIDFTLKGQLGLHIEANPDTDYARACDANDRDELAACAFDGGRKGLTYDLGGPGTAEVAYAIDGTEVIVAQGDSEEANSWILDHGSEHETPTEYVLELTDGFLIVVWAPLAATDLVSIESSPANLEKVFAAAAALNPPIGLSSGMISGVGTVARLAPGIYSASLGAYDGAEWEARWLRLTQKAAG